MTYRVAQISDTHLSRDKPFFVENFELVAAAVRSAAPDLVLNTGDISLDGATEERDIEEARRMHGAISLQMRFIPGNHDVGECHDAQASDEARISTASRERYLGHFGEPSAEAYRKRRCGGRRCWPEGMGARASLCRKLMRPLSRS